MRIRPKGHGDGRDLQISGGDRLAELFPFGPDPAGDAGGFSSKPIRHWYQKDTS
jgi:hypothetical protein